MDLLFIVTSDIDLSVLYSTACSYFPPSRLNDKFTMYHGYSYVFCWCILINVLACTLGGLGTLALLFPIPSSLSPSVLFLHPLSVASNKMLRNVGLQFHHIVSWHVIIPAYDVFHVIMFPYMTSYAIYSVLSRRITDILVL